MALIHRTFRSYDEYVHQQGRKARRHRDALLAGVPKSIRQFAGAFREAQLFLHAGPVLCLGARTGAEVIAATQAGHHGSVGIDLYPLSPDVITADWHALPFSDASFPNVYTNSLDHCLDLDRLTAEIRRVLTSTGVLYLMASDKGAKTADAAAAWLSSTKSTEALYWQHSDELRDAVAACGFHQVTAWRTGVWGHYILRSV